MDLKRIAYIALTGYGPCSDFTLAEWLEARDLYRSNQTKILNSLNLPKGLIK